MPVPDEQVLAFARSEGPILSSRDRGHFCLHQHRTEGHAGMVVGCIDPDFSVQAQRIHEAVIAETEMTSRLIPDEPPELSWL